MKPFIRYPGGKRLLAPRIAELLPKTIRTYYEPFLGAGAVYLHLAGTGRITEDAQVVLSDLDHDLIELWRAIQQHPARTLASAQRLADTASADPENAYARHRDLWNSGSRSPPRGLYLRNNSFNGLWRVNRRGEMNTPWCREPPRRYNYGPFEHAHHYLTHPRAALLSQSYCDIQVPRGAVVYCDPPYLGGWTEYTPIGWQQEDLVRLLRWCAGLDAHVVLSHADSAEVRELAAAEWPRSLMVEVTARRPINSDGAGRGAVNELLICSLT